MEDTFLFFGGPWHAQKVRISNAEEAAPIDVPVISEQECRTLSDPEPAAIYYTHRYVQYTVKIFHTEKTVYAIAGISPSELGELIWQALEGRACN